MSSGYLSKLNAFIVTLSVLALSSAAVAQEMSRGKKSPVDTNQPFPSIEISKFIVMPMASSHSDWVTAIKGARKSILMEMFHVTEKPVIDALISRAKDNIDMRVIVDHKVIGGYKAAFDTLANAGVKIRAASAFYSITHSKTMIVDDNVAWITSINMTNTGTGSRDFGITTPDTGIIAEINKVFESDWTAAGDNSNVDTTPAVSNPNLAWSPTNSTNQLVKLIDAANDTLDLEVENIGAQDILDALNRAAVRKVQVRVIIPQCSGNNTNNYAALKKLSGVQTHVEHDGKSLDQPYLHAKMIVVDGKLNYIGSINFSYNSTQKSRELGVIFYDTDIGGKLSSEFKTDWNRSVAPADPPECGKNAESDFNENAA
jgi:phosphatidylserine/phosphatidylglycerophosphate/cardiolipin synthase-like enzyme